ncbi:MlaD family protein [Pontixanthobacter sp. CEM42]|uniref:MlaD family protein n=1 Tax=Pontixanthobacter sp. CEM42 TaxID=2792077 RepID=UPI001AE06F83|nr:MlaD family protein [Pontixanthobacter sp. CEM42]
METRANHLWVGAVTLVLLGALAAFIIWLAQLGQGEQKQYDILFGQDVSGLANGSQVSFAGVPVGRVSEIKLYEDNLEFVRVRIEVEKEVPILIGTTATIQGSFTGVSTILLEGARQGAPPITCETTACFSENVPQIPPKAGGLGALLSSAPVLLERLATLTERMTELLSDRNQSEISAILANTNRMTDQLADTGPQIQATMKELENTLREGAEALDAFEKVTQSTDTLLNQEGAQLATQLRTTLGSADTAAKSLSATLDAAKPATQQLTSQTLPAVEATLEDLKATSQALRNVTERLENEGASSLLGPQPLPEYEP